MGLAKHEEQVDSLNQLNEDLGTVITNLIKAGDKMMRDLSSSPGIDIMRNIVIKDWNDAKEVARKVDFSGS